MGIKDSLDERGLRPLKKWGQNFLTDANILASIVDAAEVSSADIVLEVGPGRGHLTRALAARAAQVVAVEIDRGLAGMLERELADVKSIRIVQGDFMTRQPADWLADAGLDENRFKIVANIPYYITSAILRHILEAEVRPQTVVLMVQREVAQRMVARPPEMSILAVSVQLFAHPRIIRTISPGAFFPRPKVESAVVRLDLFDQSPWGVQDPPAFFALVRAGFGERRKQLRNSLARGLDLEPAAADGLLAQAGIDSKRRAETLSLEEWSALYRVWTNVPIARRGKKR